MVLYILLIKSNASVVTSIPLIMILIMVYSISTLALRENLDAFNDALNNIDNIKNLK